MEQKNNVIYKDNDFECYIIDGIGIVKIKDNVYEIVTDLPESSQFFDVLGKLEDNANVNSLLITNEEESLGKKAYEKYLSTVFSHQEENETWKNVEMTNRTTRTRQLIILNKLIRKIAYLPKLVVILLKGDIVTPFFGASLAADLRFATENVNFSLSHIKMNIHPSGALPYFLPKYIGQAKASEILFNKNNLTVKEAYDLGLISKILNGDNIEELVIEDIKMKINYSKNAYECTKKLLNNNYHDLEKYFSLEEGDFKQR